MQHSTDFGCSADLASGLPPEVSLHPAGDSRCAPRMPYPHDPAGMPPPVCWCLPAADMLRRNAAGYAGDNLPIAHTFYIWMQWRFGGRNIKNRRNKKHQACRSNSTGLMFSCFLYHSQKSGSGRWADANQKPRYSTGAARGNNFPARGAAVPFHRFFPFVSATLAYQTALSLGVRLPVA